MRPHRSWKISWYIVFTVLLAAPGFEVRVALQHLLQQRNKQQVPLEGSFWFHELLPQHTMQYMAPPVCAAAALQATVGWNYAVIIDAGSTGSRVHVYRYYTASSNNNLLPAVELPEAVHKTSPGLSAYAFDPKTAARSLMPLLKFAKEKVKLNRALHVAVPTCSVHPQVAVWHCILQYELSTAAAAECCARHQSSSSHQSVVTFLYQGSSGMNAGIKALMALNRSAKCLLSVSGAVDEYQPLLLQAPHLYLLPTEPVTAAVWFAELDCPCWLLLPVRHKQVPADQIATTPIQLMATAGLRMLNNGSAEAVLNEVRPVAGSSSMLCQAALHCDTICMQGAPNVLHLWFTLHCIC